MPMQRRTLLRVVSRGRSLRRPAACAGRSTGALSTGALLLWVAGACGASPDAAAGKGTLPSVLVDVAVARADTLSERLITFGTVVPAPGSARVFTAPFEGIVRRLHVSHGQRVAAGQPLADVAPSPEARLMFESARSAAAAARGRMADVQERLKLGLTTRDELLLQEQALADADARWKSYEGWMDGLAITAASGGVVDRLPVSEGERIPSGDLIVSVVSEGRFEIAAGVEPEDASLIAPGQRVRVERLADGVATGAIAGRVRSVSIAVDSATRLTSALIAPVARPRALLLGEYVRVVITVRSADGLVVPRTALLSQPDGTVLFVVRGGRAYRRLVRVGVEGDSLAQVAGEGLAAGDSVVVLGNYELADSMRVRVHGAAPASGRAASATTPGGR